MVCRSWRFVRQLGVWIVSQQRDWPIDDPIGGLCRNGTTHKFHRHVRRQYLVRWNSAEGDDYGFVNVPSATSCHSSLVRHGSRLDGLAWLAQEEAGRVVGSLPTRKFQRPPQLAASLLI